MAHIFLSHSFKDGRAAAVKLAKALDTLDGLTMWRPTREMRLGRSWTEQAHSQLANADAVILVMTKDALDFHSACRLECIAAQEAGTPVIPVRVSDTSTYPNFISPWVVWVDMYQNFDTGLALLEQEIEHLNGPRGARNSTPASTWNVGDGPFDDKGEFLIGQWLVTRQKKSGDKWMSVPDYDLLLHATSRYRSRIHLPIMNRLRMEGTWAYNTTQANLMLANNERNVLTLNIDTHLGPNCFGGVTEGRRYTAHRMLELD